MITARRLAVTILVPLLLAFLAHHVSLPTSGAVDDGRIHDALSIFNLGLTPFLSAYWLVELTALVIPRWSKLRRGDPAGRAKLDRASLVLGTIFMLLQAFGVALSLHHMGDDLEPAPIPVLMASVIGGSLITLVAARFISAYGLVNGFVALVAAQSLERSIFALGRRSSEFHLEPSVLAIDALALVVVIVAAVTMFQGAASFAGSTNGDGPYRGARQWAIHPRIPLPASSVQPFFTASAILLFPATLVNFGLPLQRVVSALNDTTSYTLALLAVALLLMVVFAAMLHRPADIADLASRLGATNPRELEGATHAALKRALVPSSLFFVTMCFASSTSLLYVITATLLVVVLTDVIHTIRSPAPIGDAVVVWEERRPTAVMMLRAALAAEGIASDVRGAATLAYFQIFAPYAPAQIVVASADVDRATQTLRHLLLGEEAPVPIDARAPWTSKETAWPMAGKSIVLAGCAVVAIGALVLNENPRHEAHGGGRANLEVLRVDDTVDPFGAISDDALPEGQGMAIYQEHVPVGSKRPVPTHFARVTTRQGETVASAFARTKAWFDSVKFPPGTRLGVEPVGDPERAEPPGFRTFVLRGDPVITSADVVDARAVAHTGESAYVSVTLSREGALRFETATREWVQRRLAIVIDGQIVVAPIVKSAIGGGHVSVTVGRGSPESELSEAEDLARKLRP